MVVGLSKKQLDILINALKPLVGHYEYMDQTFRQDRDSAQFYASERREHRELLDKLIDYKSDQE